VNRAVLASAAALTVVGVAPAFPAAEQNAHRVPPFRPGPPPLTRGSVALRTACREAGIAYPPSAPRVEIRKARRTLALFSGGTLLKEYAVGLGAAPQGDKERQGDSRTPTGTFYVCTRLEKSRFHRFLGLSYPSPDHAARGLRAGRISRAQHAAILRAETRRVKPPWDTPLGGAIGIHGGGSGFDWTLGCIAVENDEIEELFAVLLPGAPVRIIE
jgi:murein L,D-transpeptidase YafK